MKENTKRNNSFYKWISATLQNDENSTDEELMEYFMEEGKMKKEEAKFYVDQREEALKDLKYKIEKYMRKH